MRIFSSVRDRMCGRSCSHCHTALGYSYATRLVRVHGQGSLSYSSRAYVISAAEARGRETENGTSVLRCVRIDRLASYKALLHELKDLSPDCGEGLRDLLSPGKWKKVGWSFDKDAFLQ